MSNQPVSVENRMRQHEAHTRSKAWTIEDGDVFLLRIFHRRRSRVFVRTVGGSLRKQADPHWTYWGEERRRSIFLREGQWEFEESDARAEVNIEVSLSSRASLHTPHSLYTRRMAGGSLLAFLFLLSRKPRSPPKFNRKSLSPPNFAAKNLHQSF